MVNDIYIQELLFQSKLENVNLTENAVKIRPAMQIIVRTLAVFHMIHVDSRLCAQQSNIEQCAAALLDGLAVLLTNATNVGFNNCSL